MAVDDASGYHRARRRAVNHRARASSLHGFTLIELMVTLAVAAVLIAIAVPSFQSVVNSNKLAGAVNQMVASLQATRMEAVRRNQHAGMCFSSNSNAGTGATCGGADVNGWITFIDANDDGDFDDPGDTLLNTVLLQEPVAIAGSPAIGNNIVFRPDGFTRTADSGASDDLLDGVISFCIATDRPAENQRHLEIGSGSRISVSDVDGGGACAAPADP